MDSSEFRKRGKEMVDYIADYMETLSVRKVTAQVEPGYLRRLLPNKAPYRGETWEAIMKDVDNAILPGITHWQHPNFHAYFPSGNSYPSIIGDMLSDAIGCVGFSWAASPACTELETIVLDWVGKMIGLPKDFLHEGGKGGGVIQGSASECVLVTMLTARHSTLKKLKGSFPFVEDGTLLTKLVGYSSKLAHSCVEKAGIISLIKLRELEVDDNYSLRGHTLEAAIEEDRKLGLIPFFVCATLGTTAVCSFDALNEIAEVCNRERLWLHVDGAYAGNAMICPEFQHLLSGIEFAHSINFNPNKWMLVNFDCSLLWVKDSQLLSEALTVDPLYLQHPHGDKAIDFRHWGIPLSRRFRSLKLWFVLRTYGIEGLQHYIREHVRLAKLFESKVLEEDRFEVLGEVIMGLVCFRLKGPNTLTQKLLRQINESGRLHMVPALLNEHYIIRFAICAQNADDSDIIYAWQTISKIADELLASRERESSVRESRRIALSDTSEEGESAEEEEVFLEFDKENIYDNQQLNFQRARMRRNLFLRMVSDPKSYSPHMMKSYSIDDSSSRLPSDTPSETGSTNSTKRSPKTPQQATPL
ncbi:aromatic-L-amino-acid decarboxylase [Octopus bimaculoides]|nr:aromatic-L-amino-acid decarboxylase [Octopus bimaculoides]|eukprot:XP_014774406.1 PREDICTED: aromatic-L-amino-acid decarboxylase-like [Octopus bimaculoides]